MSPTETKSMDVQVDQPGGLLRQMRVRVPAERLASAMQERLKKIAGRVRIPGFRPGKAPFKVVQQQYGEAARLEAINEIVRGTYVEAVGKAGVHPAGVPQFQVTSEKPGEPLEYVASFEVYPEVKLNPLSELRVERPKVEIGEPDIDKLIGTLRRARRSLQPVERPAQEGDVCTVDFEGFVDGQPFAGGKGEKVELEIGQQQFLPELERGLIGHAAGGERFDVDVRFPDDYRREELRGKPARFSVSLGQVREPRLPEIDAEFLQAHGVDAAAGADGLRAKVTKALETERDKAIRNRVKQQVLDQLLAANPIAIPQALVAQEIPRLREEAAQRLNAGKLKPEQMQKLLPDEVFASGAQRRVALGLLIGEVIKQQKIELDGARLERVLDEIAGDYETPDQVKQYYRSRPELMQSLRAVVLEDQVVESLVAGARTAEQAMSLDELLNPKPRTP